MGLGDMFKKILGSGKKKKDNFKSQNIMAVADETSVDEDDSIESMHNSFRYLDDLIKSGVNEIVLDSDIVWKDGDKGIIFIEKDIVIDGNGHTLDARQNAGLFSIGLNKKVTIKNLTMKNASGGINNGGFLTISNCILSGNVSKYGGAIYVSDAGSLEIKDSTLSGNISNGDLRNGGGAIYVHEYASCIVRNCDFIGNESKGDGGAVFGDSRSSLLVEDSTFSNNTSEGFGGAIYKFMNSEPITIRDSSFTDNSSKRGGGAIRNHISKLNITGSDFTGNHTQGKGGSIQSSGDLTIEKSTLVKSSAADGGAIFHEDGNLSIADCPEISQNNSDSSIIHNNDEMQVYNSNFISNHCENVIVNNDNTRTGLFSAKFIDNTVGLSVIDNCAKSFTVDKVHFKGNVISESSWNIINHGDMSLISPNIDDEGKTILNNEYISIKDSPQDLENKIENNGEIEILENTIPLEEKCDFGYLDMIIHESDRKKIVLDHDICFEDYEEYFYEGGVELDIDGLVIDGNGKTINGAGMSRIFLVTADNITLRNITFINGKSHKNHNCRYNSHGGLLRVYSNARLTLENCRFLNGESEVNGGAIFNGDGIIEIIDSVFSSNSAKNGGTIYNSKCGKLNIMKSTFSDNVANSNGGAIYSFNPILEKYGSQIPDSCFLKVIESNFQNNHSASGGAIYNHEATMSVDKSSFISNSSENGGAISCLGIWSKIDITNSNFSNNTAKGNGGAIYLVSVKKESKNLKNNDFEGNGPNDIGKSEGTYML